MQDYTFTQQMQTAWLENYLEILLKGQKGCKVSEVTQYTIHNSGITG